MNGSMVRAGRMLKRTHTHGRFLGQFAFSVSTLDAYARHVSLLASVRISKNVYPRADTGVRLNDSDRVHRDDVLNDRRRVILYSPLRPRRRPRREHALRSPAVSFSHWLANEIETRQLQTYTNPRQLSVVVYTTMFSSKLRRRF